MATTESSKRVAPSESNAQHSTSHRNSSSPSINTPNHSSHPQHSDTPNSSSQPARSSSTSTSHLNPRSCVTCRRRKVRCNKENPCSNCTRAGIECVFPGPGRAPRKSRKPPDAELLARLKKLEGVVTSLGAQVDENGTLHTGHKIDGQPQPASDSPESQAGDGHRNSIDRHLGRLVINEDRSRYVSNQFWASMGDEIAEMRDLLDAATSEDELEEHESPRDMFSNHQGFIFGYSSLKVDLKSLHPSPSQIFILWEIFKENVDPVVKLLHRPTAKNILINAASSVDRVSKPAEALLFAIYFGAVVSLTEAQCRQLLDEEKHDLVKKYRFATEQALARADFLNSSSLMCLQAFIFYLVFVRHMDDSRLVWALGGLAIHLAQALGVHRDGTHFGLTPFDTEMRRRLWWHISILDNRSSEDHGTDPTFTEQFYDTKLPSNVNDDDIYPEMTAPPTERVGATEMTFCLIRFELGVFSRRLNLTQPGCNPDIKGTPCDKSFEDKEKMIDTCHRRIEEKYLQYCDMSVPIFWVSATVARLILAKMWLMVHHPRSFMMDHQGQPLPSETKDRLFVTSIEVIEFSYLLERNENTAKWGWLFRTYMQWQSVAFVLSEICVREPGVEVDRAWRAIESVYNDHFITGRMKNHKGMLWRPMRHLMAKAKGVRAKQVREGKAQPSQVQGLNQQHPISIGSTDSPTSQQPQFDFQTDPWAQHIGAATNIMGATAEALDMDFDIGTLMSPHSSEGSGSQPPQQQMQQQKQKSMPRAMSSVYGKQNPLDQSHGQSHAEQMQGVMIPQSQSPTLSVGSDFGINSNTDPNLNGNSRTASSDFGGGVGTTAADLGIGGAPASNADMGMGMGAVTSGDFNFNSPAFLNWGGWNAGVGDFNVAPITPDPMAGYWNAPQGQQEWY